MKLTRARYCLFQIDLLVLVPGNGGADLRRLLAELGLLIGEEAFLGAGGALGPVQTFKTAAQAGVAQGPIAAAVAGKLVDHAADLSHLLINVLLPGISEVLPSSFDPDRIGGRALTLSGAEG